MYEYSSAGHESEERPEVVKGEELPLAQIPLTVISAEQESLPMSLEAWQKYFPVSALSAFRMVRWAVFSAQLIL